MKRRAVFQLHLKTHHIYLYDSAIRKSILLFTLLKYIIIYLVIN